MAKHTRILLVDDDPLILELFGSKLAEAGFRVIYARDGDEARDMLKRAEVDLVILDVLMPRMDGIACLTALRQDPKTKDLPVIFLTNLEKRPEDIRAAEELGAIGIFKKTMDLNEFVKKAREVAAQTS